MPDPKSDACAYDHCGNSSEDGGRGHVYGDTHTICGRTRAMHEAERFRVVTRDGVFIRDETDTLPLGHEFQGGR